MDVTPPPGSWPTPITSALVVLAAGRLGEVVVDGRAADADVWWSESRPQEAGRTAIVRRSADGAVTDVLTVLPHGGLLAVADLGALAAETHTFESRSLDGLVAPLEPDAGPEGTEASAERSPITTSTPSTPPWRCSGAWRGPLQGLIPPGRWG